MRRIEPTIPDDLKKLVMSYKNLFAGESADAVLKDLKNYCGANKPVFIKRTGEQADPLELAFLDGRRDVIHYIMRLIQLDLPTG